jgi:TIR domain
VKSKFENHSLWHNLSATWSKFRAEGIIRLAEAVDQHSYFLSYSHKDLAFCDFVDLSLFQNNRVVLRDQNQLRAGKPVQSKLSEAIGRAQTFVLLWNAASSKSAWCLKELKLALELNHSGLPPHRIVLFRRDKATVPAKLLEYLQLDARDRVQADLAVQRLVLEEGVEG